MPPARRPRLKSAATLADECATLPGSADTAWDVGAGSYRASWSYSDSGRVLSRMTQEHGAASPTVYSYDYLDAHHPHAATSVDDGTTTTAYAYDDAGRMVDRDADAAGTGTSGDLQLQWDVLSNLVATTGGGSEVVYLYDASGQRVAHMDVTGNRATAFLGDTQATDSDTTTNSAGMSATRYFTHGGATVAVAQTEWTGTATTAPEWFFLFGDHQGSAQLLVDADNPAEFTRTAYTPYGSERGDPTGTLAPDPDLGTTSLGVDRGWLAQTYDGGVGETAASSTGTGLTYLNARYYDTLLARFISPDPLMNPTDPQTLDPYRYADNNPILKVDASGLAASCSGIARGTAAWDACNGYASTSMNPTGFKRTPMPVKYKPRWIPQPREPHPLRGIPADEEDLQLWIPEHNKNAEDTRRGLDSKNILWNFAFGVSMENYGGDAYFGEDYRYTDALRANTKLQEAIGKALIKKGPSVGEEVKFRYGAGSNGGPVSDLRCALRCRADDPELALRILGSFEGSARVLKTDQAKGQALIRVSISNDMSFASVTRIPGNYNKKFDDIRNSMGRFIGVDTIRMRITYTEWYNYDAG